MTTVEERVEAVEAEDAAPAPLPAHPDVPLPPDTFAYRMKCKLLGQPMHTEQLEHERLGRPTALAVFASDNLSSSAYATEEILRVLVPAAGAIAFSLVMPVTIAMILVLGLLILSYRETIKAYPSAGGAYLVTRDNFGIVPAQVAGVALLTDYILTVAVSVSAGTAALVSAFHVLSPVTVPISVFFIVIIAFGNLRGMKESGKVFAVPTYFFVVNMFVLLAIGLPKAVAGDLPKADPHAHGLVDIGHASGLGLLMGVALFKVLHAFASGGAAVTGVEAISNGVPAFKKPEWKNARSTLVVMGTLLGVMFLGLSYLASKTHVIPFDEGTPTVISQIGDLVYGTSAVGRVLFYSLQAGTMLILVLAANTGFADFPRLASFQAGDTFMPRQLTKRGHRLVFSNGILFLSGAATLLVLVTGAKVDHLIPLYAVGVFTSFTLSQSGMARHHIRLKEPHWKKGLVINSVGAAISALVAVIIGATKFTEGAWVILILIPLMVVFLLRLSKQYGTEAEHLDEGVAAAIAKPIMRRHVVLVFVDRLDLAAARALQYARSLMPDEVRAVHFAVDDQVAELLKTAWTQHQIGGRIGLDIVACPDRRLTRAAVETAARELADGTTEVSVLLPERKYSGFWHRILHDQTADSIVREVGKLPHANVTLVPFHFTGGEESTTEAVDPVALRTVVDRPAQPVQTPDQPPQHRDGVTPIGVVRFREMVTVEGRVHTLRVQPLGASSTLEVIVSDGTGQMSLIFLGRPTIPGIEVGTPIRAEGRATNHRGRLAIFNPIYDLRSNGH